jgi:hypothetical protein
MRTIKITEAILLEKNYCEDGTMWMTFKKMKSVSPSKLISEPTAQEIIDEIQ